MPQPAVRLQRHIGLWATVAIVAGSVIGSSIFMKPAVMAGQLNNPLLLSGIWLLAGVLSYSGAMINAEIGAMLPHTGGQYVFFQKMYGEGFAWLYGWASFSVVNTAAVGAIAYVFAQYTGYFIQLPHFSPAVEQSWQLTIPYIGELFPLQNMGVKALAILLIMVLTWLNYRSVKTGANVQLFFSGLKVLALLLLIAVIFFSGKGNWQNLYLSEEPVSLSSWITIGGCIAALSGAFAAYDGWNNIGFVAGEIKDPAKNIPRGLFIGLGICVLLYMLVNASYLYMLPVQQMKHAELVATDAVTPILGVAGTGLIAAMVMLSVSGAVNGNILACARVTFAMAEQGLFFRSVGRVHPRFYSPGRALWLHAVWSSLYVITGSFDMLTDLFVFISWIFYGFAAAGIFILRKKMKEAERPYRAWGYPIVPALFVLFTICYIVITMYNDITAFREGKTKLVYSVWGIALTLAGLPLYYYFRGRNKLDV